jgi:hypothetical protein
MNTTHCIYNIPTGATTHCGCVFYSPPAGYNLLADEVSWSHNDAPQSVGLLWTSVQSFAETSTWQQTNIHAPGGIRTHDRSRRVAVDLRLRPRLLGPARTIFRSANICSQPLALKLGYPWRSGIKQATGSFRHFLVYVYILCLRPQKTKYNESCLLANLMNQTNFNHAFWKVATLRRTVKGDLTTSICGLYLYC